jgi:epoxyqueuosine reductase
MLVHPRAGMWFSCRGVLALPDRIALPVPPASPCATCADRPCLTACPVGALGPAPYDVPACAAHLRGAGRRTCLASGCAVRHACPAGAAFRPLPSQAARHMAAFLAGQEETVDKAVDKQSGT